jgi:hypothetical protein
MYTFIYTITFSRLVAQRFTRCVRNCLSPSPRHPLLSLSSWTRVSAPSSQTIAHFSRASCSDVITVNSSGRVTPRGVHAPDSHTLSRTLSFLYIHPAVVCREPPCSSSRAAAHYTLCLCSPALLHPSTVVRGAPPHAPSSPSDICGSQAACPALQGKGIPPLPLYRYCHRRLAAVNSTSSKIRSTTLRPPLPSSPNPARTSAPAGPRASMSMHHGS